MTTQNEPIEYEQFTGAFGARVDGWWQPEKGSVVEGILIGFISQDRSEKLKSDNLVLELISDCKSCHDSKADKSVLLKKGQNVGVPVWKQLEGLYPDKLGHAVKITMTGTTKIAGRTDMKDFDTKTSTKPVCKMSAPSSANANGSRSNEPVPFDV